MDKESLKLFGKSEMEPIGPSEVELREVLALFPYFHLQIIEIQGIYLLELLTDKDDIVYLVKNSGFMARLMLCGKTREICCMKLLSYMEKEDFKLVTATGYGETIICKIPGFSSISELKLKMTINQG